MKSLTNFEQFNEGASKKKVDANVIADRMMDANLGGHYLLRRYAEEVRALKRVSEYDVDQIIPDHLPGHLIYGLFKESNGVKKYGGLMLDEAKEIELGGIKAERFEKSGIGGWKLTVGSALGRGTQVIMIPDSTGTELFQFLHKNT